jgi:hypothetical protein
MKIYNILSDKEYAASVQYFTGKKAIEREERYLQFLYNSVQRYQKDTNVSFLNNILISAKIAGKVRAVKKLIDAIKLHKFDKESGLFVSDGKLDEKKLASLRANWELIFEEWLSEDIKAEKKAVEFTEEKAFSQIFNIIKKMQENLGLSESEAKEHIVRKLSSGMSF